MTLAVEEVRDPEAIPRLKEAWTELVDRSAEADLFQTYEWVTSWLAAFGRGRRPRFLFVREGSRLVGLAPFVEDRDGSLWCPRTLASPVDDESFRTGFIAAEERAAAAEALFRHLDKTQPGRPVVFRKVEPTAGLGRAFEEAARGAGRKMVTVKENPSPIFRLEGDWEAFLKRRSSHFRSELKRKRKRLEAAAAAREKLVLKPDELAEAFADILAIERASWKEAAATSFTARPAVAEFFKTFGRQAAERGWLRLRLLYMDDRPAAYVFALARKGEFLTLKTSYDEARKSLSPGSVLFESVAREAFREGGKAFDIMGVEARWKNEYGDGLRALATVCFFPKGSLRCWRCLALENHVRPFVAKRLPWVGSVKRRLPLPFSKK